jgi:hypothetical protein
MKQQQYSTEIKIMARIGKIGRLPRAVRIQLNYRLQDGQEGKQIVQWLNTLPQVKEVVAERFNGRPVSEQNLSDWRQGGYEEWLAYQDLVAQAGELAANRRGLEAAAPGQSPADLLAAAVSFRYGAILAGQGLELDEKSLVQLRALGHVCQAVVKLRRSDQDAARAKIETERWDLERHKIQTDTVEETQEKIRAALAARITTWMKMPEWHTKLGGSPRASMIAAVLREIEICADPAHYHSEIIGDPGWERYVAEETKKAQARKTEMQAALDTYREMETGLGVRKIGKEEGSAQPRSKTRWRARKGVGRQGRGCKAGTRKGLKGRKGRKGLSGAEPQARRYKAATRGVPAPPNRPSRTIASTRSMKSTPLLRSRTKPIRRSRRGGGPRLSRSFALPSLCHAGSRRGGGGNPG